MLPGAVAYTYLGYAGREAVVGGEGMIQKALVVAFNPDAVTAQGILAEVKKCDKKAMMAGM